MLTTTLLTLMSFAPQGGSTAPVVINEFSYDDSGTDDHEFVELLNRSNTAVDISGWVLDSQDENGPNTAYTVAPSTVLLPGGYWVMGSALVPNVDQVVGTTNIWENSQESLELLDLSGAVIDALVYEVNKNLWPITGVAEGQGIWANFTSIAGNETSWSRIRDGWDSDSNGDDFRMQPWSPGTTNTQATLERGQYTYDASVVGTALAEWGASFASAKVIDPTVADSDNPNVIPVSPQGGNAAIFWDSTGGGNHNMFLADGAVDSHVEAWVYLDAVPRATGFQEQWTFGFGTSGTFYNYPDANGDTGVAWNYVVNDVGATLSLYDYNDGGHGANAITPPVLLGQVTIQPGVNDGWQRLSISIVGRAASGRFGGTYGGTNGTQFTGAITAGVRGLYVGYRELNDPNTANRPFTCDNLLLANCSPASSRILGIATPNGAGVTPAIGISGPPTIGTTTTISAVGMAPGAGAIAHLLIGVERASPITIGPLGQAGFAIWVDPILTVGVPVSPAGTVSNPQQIPLSPEFCGIELSYQWLQVDPTIPAAIPAFHTEALVIHIGV